MLPCTLDHTPGTLPAPPHRAPYRGGEGLRAQRCTGGAAVGGTAAARKEGPAAAAPAAVAVAVAVAAAAPAVRGSPWRARKGARGVLRSGRPSRLRGELEGRFGSRSCGVQSSGVTGVTASVDQQMV